MTLGVRLCGMVRMARSDPMVSLKPSVDEVIYQSPKGSYRYGDELLSVVGGDNPGFRDSFPRHGCEGGRAEGRQWHLSKKALPPELPPLISELPACP
jgi:hypothetical protein